MDKERKIFCLLAVLVFSGSASAYIDPGTAGMIVGGSIWPLIAAALAAVGGVLVKFFNPIKQGATGIWQKIRKKQQ